MVDFSKKLRQKPVEKVLDPVALYDTLDRASDKGPLRPAQEAILREWHSDRRTKRDNIVKLHTGQGKTLIGLLMLQSLMNEKGGPSAYLCPNKYLVTQTCNQARQFGIDFVTDEDDGLPAAFLDGGRMYIGLVQKLFNGWTQFGIGNASISLNSILLDDAHACIDAIRDSLLIRIMKNEEEYRALRDLFADSLKSQGMGTFEGILNGDPNESLLVPYWVWQEKQEEIVHTLARRSREARFLRFVWPLLKDQLIWCQCFVSGSHIDIVPHLAPLDMFGSYYKAKHRIFMSATVTDDSFLIKGLEVLPDSIRSPLVYKRERWSGEKMILIPSLIDESLDRSTIVAAFAKPESKRHYGVVALTPSFETAKNWQHYEAIVPTSSTIEAVIEALLDENYAKTVVFANRYDGIDLPDDACRVLIIDGNPHAENLIDRYSDDRRVGSATTAIRRARVIEQGLGRAVRGEKDYCVILLIGPVLVRNVRTNDARKYLSNQTRTQVEIGLEVADMANQDVKQKNEPINALFSLIKQLIGRDADWKKYYTEQMETVISDIPNRITLEIFQKELDAERQYRRGNVQGAIQLLQTLVDEQADANEKGWYLQEIARYTYHLSQSESNTRQLAAHTLNHRMLLPREGLVYKRLQTVSQRRMENIKRWIQKHENGQELTVAVDAILANLVPLTQADKFENALNELAEALGFAGERPDKEWGEGPDNLWALSDNEYLNIECKSEVKLDRKEINEDETEQMNRSYAWFCKKYPGTTVTNLIIHPGNKVAKDAAFLQEAKVKVMTNSKLNMLQKSVRNFFDEFRDKDFHNLSDKAVQALVDMHRLSVDTLTGDDYMTLVRQRSGN